jgi:hypothetical protein
MGRKSNYANVFVNGNLIGLYSNSEAISKKFVDKHYGSKNNTRVKYLAHVKTMLQENFANGSYEDTAVELRSTIDAAVQADDNKFFTYANFVSNLASDVGGGGGGPGGGGSSPGITTLMDARVDYLLGLSDFTQTEPVIDGIALSTATQASPSTDSSSQTTSVT